MIITGSKGFIGSALMRAAINEGHSVVGIAEHIKGAQVALDTKDGVFVHLGANPGVLESIADPVGCFVANTSATVEYLAAAADNGIERFLFASSHAATHPPTNPYGASKAAAEAFCWAYTHTYHLKCLILRLSNVYGPGSKDKGSVVAQMCRDALTRGEITVHGDGTQKRDFIHVDDVVEAILAFAYAPQVYVGAVSICSGSMHCVQDVADIIKAETGCTVRQIASRPGEAPALEVKPTEAIDWSARIDFESGVRETLVYFKRALAQ